MLSKKILSKILVFFISANILFADHYWRRPAYRYHRQPVYRNYYQGPIYQNRISPRYNDNRISPGAATAIGLGAGVVGFVIGRSTKSKEVVYKDQKIQCKDFDIKVIIDGEEKKAKVTKCRTDDGDWKIPD
jgi:hypothetical protein